MTRRPWRMSDEQWAEINAQYDRREAEHAAESRERVERFTGKLMALIEAEPRLKEAIARLPDPARVIIDLYEDCHGYFRKLDLDTIEPILIDDGRLRGWSDGNGSAIHYNPRYLGEDES